MSKTQWRVLCGEPQNYSAKGLAAVEAVAQLTAQQLTQAAPPNEQAPHYDAVMVRLQLRVDEPLMHAQRLKAILTPTTGLNHIALEAAEAHDVAVFHLRGETAFLQTITSTAEHTWGLLLALVRKTPEAYQSVKEGQWVQQPFRGRELKGKRLGILGHGRLGSIIGRYGHAFDMKVLVYDPYIETIPDYVLRCRSLNELLAQSDILSIHVPLNAETTNMIGAEALAHLPQGAFVVNTARGEIVDEAALIALLKSGHIAGAAVDVLGQEHQIHTKGHPLIEYAQGNNNLLITPHIGGAAWEAIEQTDLFIIEKWKRWMRR